MQRTYQLIFFSHCSVQKRLSYLHQVLLQLCWSAFCIKPTVGFWSSCIWQFNGLRLEVLVYWLNFIDGIKYGGKTNKTAANICEDAYQIYYTFFARLSLMESIINLLASAEANKLSVVSRMNTIIKYLWIKHNILKVSLTTNDASFIL